MSSVSMKTVDADSVMAPGDSIGWYRVERILGRGGFGVTYLALDTNLDLQVAIKEYFPKDIASRDSDHSVRPVAQNMSSTYLWGLDRFIKEARTLARFKHPNIVRVMSVFEKNHTAYMVMEYEKGQDFSRLLEQPGINEETNLKRIIGPIINGLKVVHEHGFIHRDIKPANIRIHDDGTPVLIDFGSARQALSTRTKQLTAMVTVGYSPLEQYNDAESDQQGPWSDIYALGAVLYHAISGKQPVASTLRVSTVVNGQKDPLPPVGETTQNHYSDSFLSAIDWALSFKVSDRPQTLDEWQVKLFADDSTVLMPAGKLRAEYRSEVKHAHDSDSVGTEQQKLQLDSLTDRSADVLPQHPSHLDSDDWKASRESVAAWDVIESKDDSGLERETLAKSKTSNTARRRVGWIFGSVLCLVLALVAIYLWQARGEDERQLQEVLVEQQRIAGQEAERQRQEVLAEAQRQATQEAERRRQEALAEEQRQAAQEAQRQRQEVLAEEQRQAAQEAERQRQEVLAEEQRQAAQEAERQLQEVLAEERRQAAQEVVRRRQEALAEEQRRAAQQAELQNKQQADKNIPITPNELSQVIQQFINLKRAIENKDLLAISEVTENSESKNRLLARLFEKFESFETELSGISAQRSKQSIQGTLKIVYMKRSNGNRQEPPESLREITLTAYRVGEGWSPVHW